MAVQRTLSIIKPDAVAKSVIGDIIRRFEENGLEVVAARMVHLTEKQGGQFYAVHAERPFYRDLCAYISSGPILALVLEGQNAVSLNRQLMGATNPKEAEPGTIRADHAESIEANSVHGSDSPENAVKEISFFFRDLDINSRR
ncbi:MAG: nucleoside-diphosphate kinase [Mariprofundaceae bacterium]